MAAGLSLSSKVSMLLISSVAHGAGPDGGRPAAIGSHGGQSLHVMPGRQ
jgi:hypothetical protein